MMSDALFTILQVGGFATLAVGYIVRDYPWKKAPKRAKPISITFMLLGGLLFVGLLVLLLSGGLADAQENGFTAALRAGSAFGFLVIAILSLAVWPLRKNKTDGSDGVR